MYTACCRVQQLRSADRLAALNEAATATVAFGDAEAGRRGAAGVLAHVPVMKGTHLCVAVRG